MPMLDKIIRFSLQNRAFILMAAVLLMVGGIYTTSHIDVDVFPDLKRWRNLSPSL